MPLTERGLAQSTAAGRWFAREGLRTAHLLTSPTRRTRETAANFAAGQREVDPSVPELEPETSAAMRNPDLYFAGHLVNMVSSPEAFAEQAIPITEQDVVTDPFFSKFLTEDDRVGFWVAHSNPPGDTVLAVGRRIEVVARSLAYVSGWAGETVVGITHSPVLRAIAVTFHGFDPGEPRHLHGYSLTVHADGRLDVDTISPEAE